MRNESSKALKSVVRHLQRTSLVTAITVLLFCVFFQGSKQISLLRVVNPFLEDPYDSIGSITVQIAFFVALLNLVRAFSCSEGRPISLQKYSFTLRGNGVALAAVVVTLSTDILAEIETATLWPASAGELILNSALWGLILGGWALTRQAQRTNA